MKQQLIRIAGVFCILLMAAAAMAGTWSTNNFLYQPDLGARGGTEKNTFDTGLNRVDAHLGQYKTLGDPGYSTLAEALTTIGSNNVTLTIPAGTVTIASNTTVGNNIALRVFKGGKFNVNSGITLTINGPVDAGPYQIFSGTGTVTLGGVSTVYDVWYAVPPSNPEGNIAAPIGSRFVKTAGSAPLVYVKESGTGISGWVAGSGGSGAAAFTGLTDVPSTYGGQAGKALRVNANSNGLEYYNPSSSGGIKPFIIYGESGYATLSQALTTIGSTQTTMIIPAETGAIPVTSNTTIPANVDLRVFKGAKFDIANGVTLTINSAIEAGPYQIFSWTGTGTINISGSPTQKCFIQWWGAARGVTNDCSSAINKAVEGMRNTQELHFPYGAWRIASPITIAKPWGFSITGEGAGLSCIYVDVGGGNIGLTLGSGTGDQFYYNIRDISFIGPANCCSYGVKVTQAHSTTFKNVDFYLGATEYALWVHGSIFFTGDPLGCRNHQTYPEGLIGNDATGNVRPPANGFKFTDKTSPSPNYGTNVTHLNLIISGMTINGYGLYLYNSGQGFSLIDITGDIEGCPNGAIYAEGINWANFHNVYSCDNNGGAFTFKNCANLRIVGGNWVYDPTNPPLRLLKCCNAYIDNLILSSLEIDRESSGVSLGNLTIKQANGLKDYAPDTIYRGSVVLRDGTKYYQTNFPISTSDRKNIVENSLLNRWQADRPDGWGKSVSTVYTQCGIGLADTTHRGTNYCAKIQTSGNTAANSYYLSTTQMNLLKGKDANFSTWVYVPIGQSFSSYPTIRLSIGAPDWIANTPYKAGDYCEDGSGHLFMALNDGTSSSSAPSWNTTVENNTTDNDITWQCRNNTSWSNTVTPITADDLGNWKRLTCSLPIPQNVDTVYVGYYLYRQQNSSESTMYMSEPTLMAGKFGPYTVVPGQNEFSDSLQMGPLKVTWGPSASGNPTGWRRRGDQHWWTDPSAGQSPGVVATADGSPATWKTMPALGN